jgi:isoleucyl-tRNA synthetase
VILGDDGKKASKSRRNYPDPDEVFDTYGSDALRWSLLSSPVLRGGDLIVSSASIDQTVRAVLRPLWNSWYFFAMYANAENRRAVARVDSSNVLDRYVLAKARRLVEKVTECWEAYDLSGTCFEVRRFMEALTNWYIRRSRARFWDGEEDAFDTLSVVLETLCRVVAPMLPFVAEEIWQGLTGGDSVHLAQWPEPGVLPDDPDLVVTMDRVREVCSAVSSVRKAQGLRVRLPVAAVTVAAPDAARLEQYRALIADEVNAHAVQLTEDVSSTGVWELAMVPGVLGPRVKGQVQELLRAVKDGSWERDADGAVTVLGRRLAEDEYVLRLVPADEAVSRVLEAPGGVVVVDVTSSAELEAEGIARDVLRKVQQTRRDAGLKVSDRIILGIATTTAVADAIRAHEARLVDAVLAVGVEMRPQDADGEWLAKWEHTSRMELDEEPLTIGVRLAHPE